MRSLFEVFNKSLIWRKITCFRNATLGFAISVALFRCRM